MMIAVSTIINNKVNTSAIETTSLTASQANHTRHNYLPLDTILLVDSLWGEPSILSLVLGEGPLAGCEASLEVTLEQPLRASWWKERLSDWEMVVDVGDVPVSHLRGTHAEQGNGLD